MRVVVIRLLSVVLLVLLGLDMGARGADVDELVREVLSRHPQLEMARAALEEAESREAQLRALLKPRIDTAGSYAYRGPVAELEVIESPPPAPRARVRVESAEEAPRELNLIGLDSERAREDLERFLDQAFTAGAASIRIVHGHGTGVLRKMVADVCRSHPAVRSFRHPPQHFGGTGATEVELEPGG